MFELATGAAYLDAIMDDRTKTELEAAVLRRLIGHLQHRTDVQNIDLMNLAGFCRNCLSNWMEDAARERQVPLSKADARKHVYGMDYEQWKVLYQKEANKAQMDKFNSQNKGH